MVQKLKNKTHTYSPYFYKRWLIFLVEQERLKIKDRLDKVSWQVKDGAVIKGDTAIKNFFKFNEGESKEHYIARCKATLKLFDEIRNYITQVCK